MAKSEKMKYLRLLLRTVECVDWENPEELKLNTYYDTDCE